MSAIEDLLARVLPPWHSKVGALARASLVGFVVYGAMLGIQLPWMPAATLSVIASMTIFVLLLVKSTPPRNRQPVLAIGISISADTELERSRVRREVIGGIKETFANSSTSPFPVLVVPDHLAIDARDVPRARELMRRMNVQFLIWGDIRTRKHQGEDVYVLAIDGGVAHQEVDAAIAARLAQEMCAVLPLKSVIRHTNELQEFSVLADDYSRGIRYALAVAQMFSANFELAQTLLSSIVANPELGTSSPLYQNLTELAKQRAMDCLLARSALSHIRWRISRDPADLVQMESILEDYRKLKISPDPQYWMGKAICAFVLRQDISESRKNLNFAATSLRQDAASRYGLAFLDAVQGDMDSSYRNYRDAIDRDTDRPAVSTTGEPTAFEIEEFVAWYLEKNPSCTQLWFSLGYLNLKRKGDKKSALENFQRFLASGVSSKYPHAKYAAEKYVRQLYTGTATLPP